MFQRELQIQPVAPGCLANGFYCRVNECRCETTSDRWHLAVSGFNPHKDPISISWTDADGSAQWYHQTTLNGIIRLQNLVLLRHDAHQVATEILYGCYVSPKKRYVDNEYPTLSVPSNFRQLTIYKDSNDSDPILLAKFNHKTLGAGLQQHATKTFVSLLSPFLNQFPSSLVAIVVSYCYA